MNDLDLNRLYRIRDIILTYLNGNISTEEEVELSEWLIQKESNDRLFQEIINQANISQVTKRFKELEDSKEATFQQICSKIRQPVPGITRVLSPSKLRYIAAAISLLIISVGAFFYVKQYNTTDLKVEVNHNDIPPGRNRAMLTLADGSLIALDSVHNGALTQQGNTKVLKLNNGQLVYEKNGHSEKGSIFYNTIATPRGGQYQLQLPDGSKVWLNAASSLRFPTVFDNRERSVELTGEAYFEITRIHQGGKKVPFRVDILSARGGAAIGEVEVLGTHFNIMAYQDEEHISTTLLEGSVKVTKGVNTTLLAPGQQAEMGEFGEIKLHENANLEEVMAWKNGYFQFNRTDLKAVMRQISRWYNVDVSYEGTVADRQFGGKISRDANASEVLKILELSNVHFRIEDKRIVVIP